MQVIYRDARGATPRTRSGCSSIRRSTRSASRDGREHLPRVANGIPVVRTDRGGQITYHGPGQVVLYTLLDLRRRGLAVRPLVRLLERSVIDLLAAYGIAAAARVEAPGVYVDGAKIAALGLRIRDGLLLPRARLQCRHGSHSVPRDRPLRLFRAGGDAGARTRHHRRAGTPGRKARPIGIEQADMSAVGEKAEGPAEDGAHPDQGGAGGAAREAGLDPRAPGQRRALPRDQADTARAPPAYRVRGGDLPQHRRVLRQGHGDLHDPRRPLHPPLPVLRRRARQAPAARCATSRSTSRAPSSI